jgi:hypothetical protein
MENDDDHQGFVLEYVQLCLIELKGEPSDDVTRRKAALRQQLNASHSDILEQGQLILLRDMPE